jgi:hypothetical protein
VSRRRRELGMQLKFSTRQCRCGEQRLVGRSCVTCGMRPRSGEVDTEVLRRKRILAQVKGEDLALCAREDIELTELTDRLGNIIDSFLRPLAAMSRPDGGGAVGELIQARCRVEQLVLDASVPMRRPYREVGKVLASIVNLIRDSLFGFLEVLGADDPVAAESGRKSAQAQLDVATGRLGDLSRAIDDLLLVVSSDHGSLLELLSRRLVDAPQTGILGADQAGHATVQRVIGASEQPAAGVGLGVLWGAAVAQVVYDYDRFSGVASVLYQLMAGPGAFAVLAADSAWRQRHEKALVALLDSSDMVERMLSVAPHDRATVRSLLLFVQDVFEGACKHFAATILAQTGSRTYADLMDGRRSAALVHQVNDDPSTQPLAEGLLGRLRNSSGHYDFEVRNELIILDPGPREVVRTAEEFTDDLLYFVESAAALCLAFEIALAQRGTPTVITGGHPLLTPEYVLRLMATAAGLWDVRVTMMADTIAVVGTGALEAPFSTAGALLTAIPERVAVLSLVWDVDGRLRELVVPVPLARSYLQVDETDTFAKELAFMELGCMTTLDGQPFYTPAAFRHSVALKAGAVVKATPTERGRRFRILRELAIRVGDLHCAEVLRLITRVQRLMVQGEVAEPDALQALDELSAWESTPVSEVFVEN